MSRATVTNSVRKLADDSRFVADFLGDREPRRVPAVYPPCHADLCGTWDPEFHGREKLGRAPRSIRGGQQTPIAGKFRSIPPAPQVGHQSQTGTIGKHGRCRRRPANSLLKPDSAFIAELFPRRPALLSRRPGHARPDATCRDDRDERDRRDGRDDTIRQT